MCFHVRQSKEAQEVKHRFNAKIEDESLFQTSNHINGFTFPKTPVITNIDKSLIKHFQWGLIPLWAKDESIKKYTLNAKIETLAEKSSFKNCINNRCLIIADGFYEWKWLDEKGKNKQLYLITLPENALFSFAGIWSKWTHKTTQEIIYSYSLITTEANELMREIHNSQKRMPLILTRDLETKWLYNRAINDFKDSDINLRAIEVPQIT